jgi:hypothetical protein
MTYGIAKMKLHYTKAKVEHGASYGDADNSKPVQAISSHAQEGKQDAEFKS